MVDKRSKTIRISLANLFLLLAFQCVLVTANAETDSDIELHAYEALLESKECHTSGVKSIICTYSLKDSLDFSVDGVGEVDAAVTFHYVSAESRYYARFGSRPGCVLIQRKSTETITPLQAMKDLAYVSLQNGKVYRTWPECKKSE